MSLTLSRFEVMILGGGPAGYGAALSLSRQRHTTVLFDSGVFRNKYTTHMHNVPTWDHRSPSEYRSTCRAELQAKYHNTKIVDLKITDVYKNSGGSFIATDEKGGVWESKKLILATGVRDFFPPEIPGYEQCWGTSIFHCLYCHGYEESPAKTVGVLALGILSIPEQAIRRARQILQFTERVVILTHGNNELVEQLQQLLPPNKPIEIDNRPMAFLQKAGEQTSDVIIAFQNGEQARHGFLTHIPFPSPNLDFASRLGLQLAPLEMEVNTVNIFGESDVPGCFVAGDIATPAKSVVSAINTGVLAAAGCADQLQNEN